MYIWDRENECILHSRLHELQLERLRHTIARCAENVPLYRSRLAKAGVTPGKIRSLSDITAIPFMTAEDLKETYPTGLLAVPIDKVALSHTFSTGGDHLQVLSYTRGDLKLWSELAARLLAMAGVNAHSIVQVAFLQTLLAEGFSLHQGVERIGARLVPTPSADVLHHVCLIRDLATTHLACTPTYAFQIIGAMREAGVRFAKTKIQALIVGGEPWAEMTRQQIESQIGLPTYDHYGPGAIRSAGVAAECRARDGLHIFEDHFLAEVVDPDSGDPLPDGTIGELVLTTLTAEAEPLLRYRTGDLTAITRHPCDCGRTLARMSRVTRRTDQTLVIEGVSVLPSQIEHALIQASGRVPNYQIVLDRDDLAEDMELKVEITPEILSDEMKNLRLLEGDLQVRLRRLFGFTTKVTFVEPGSLPHAETAGDRVVNRR